MQNEYHQKAIVEPGGVITLRCKDLPAGIEADVIVRFRVSETSPSYRSLFGSGKGGFSSAEEADTFLRKERDSWD